MGEVAAGTALNALGSSLNSVTLPDAKKTEVYGTTLSRVGTRIPVIYGMQKVPAVRIAAGLPVMNLQFDGGGFTIEEAGTIPSPAS